jgi:phage FluMu protein Com
MELTIAMWQAVKTHQRVGDSLYGGLIIAALVGYRLWRLSLRTHGYRRCPRCKGTGRLYNPVLSGSFRLCPRCKGSSRLVRRGARPGG